MPKVQLLRFLEIAKQDLGTLRRTLVKGPLAEREPEWSEFQQAIDLLDAALSQSEKNLFPAAAQSVSRALALTEKLSANYRSQNPAIRDPFNRTTVALIEVRRELGQG